MTEENKQAPVLVTPRFANNRTASPHFYEAAQRDMHNMLAGEQTSEHSGHSPEQNATMNAAPKR